MYSWRCLGETQADNCIESYKNKEISANIWKGAFVIPNEIAVIPNEIQQSTISQGQNCILKPDLLNIWISSDKPWQLYSSRDEF